MIEHLTPSQANRAGREPCLGKKKCVLVFIAPWCPACKLSLSGIKALVEIFRGSAEIGINVVVGGDNPEGLEAMASNVGDYSFVDLDGAFQKVARVGSIPHWFVIDSKKKILHEMHGSLGEDAPVAEYLRYLKLGS